MNCIPVIADAAPGRFMPGPREIEAVLTPRTRAIVVAHIYGEPADMPGILRVARRRRLAVVEDCAQAHGARLNGQALGTFGDLAAFSTMFGKHHCTGGQGGLVFTRREALYWKVRRAADRGKPIGLKDASGGNVLASLNFNMDEIGACIGRVQLRKLPRIVERRRALIGRIAAGLRGLRAVSVPPQVRGAEPSYWFFRLRFHPEAAGCDKPAFCQALAAEGLSVRVRYVNPCHMQDWYRERRVFGPGGMPWTAPQYQGDPNRAFPCPNALAALDAHFDIPVSESWSERDADDVAAIFRKVARAYERRR